MGTGRSDEAIEAYRKAVSPEPGFAVAYSNLGNALQQRARTEEAMAALQMAIRLDPDLPDARNNYGNALKDLARLDEACDEYRIAVRQRPSTALFGSELGLRNVVPPGLRPGRRAGREPGLGRLPRRAAHGGRPAARATIATPTAASAWG